MTTITITPPSSDRAHLHDGPAAISSIDGIDDVPETLYQQIVDLLKNTRDDLSEKLIMTSAIGKTSLVTKVAFRYTDAIECRNEALIYAQLKKLQSKHFAPVLYYGEREVLYEIDGESFSASAVIVSYKEVPGVTLRRFLRVCSPNQLLTIVLQLFTALKEAHDQIGFTHYDLHSNNLIVTPDLKICFIDYGSSYASSDVRAGIILPLGAIRKETWWLHDVFKILCSLYTQTELKFLIKDLGERLIEEKARLKKEIRTSTDIIVAINRYELQGELYRQFIWAIHSIEGDEREYVKRVAKQARRHILKIKRERELERLIERKEANSLNALFIKDLLAYFTVRREDGEIINDLYQAVSFIRSLDRYYAISPEEASDGSFDDFYNHLVKVEKEWRERLDVLMDC